MSIEEIKDCYFNNLVNKIMNSLYEAKDYNCKDYELIKLELILNLHRFLETREKYNKNIDYLRRKDNENKKIL